MKIVVALTGASGVIYGLRLIEELSKNNEVYAVISDSAKKVIKYEHPEGMKINKKVKVFSQGQIGASIASSSFGVDAMVICPCSMKTLAAVSVGYSENLIVRCADVMIKERKKLVLAVRETPFSPIHLENMLKLSRLGVVILPLSPAWYNKPKNLDDMISFIIGKVLDSLGIQNNLYKRWK
jgi:4-hydroxy-3-polyprenylbenzoate decarboxylase